MKGTSAFVRIFIVLMRIWAKEDSAELMEHPIKSEHRKSVFKKGPSHLMRLMLNECKGLMISSSSRH